MRYLITFACYGAHLHGDESGSIDPSHNFPGSPVLKPNSRREAFEREQMGQAPYRLGRDQRIAVLKAAREVCLHRQWLLLAAHVRTNHVHAVVEADVQPERIMNALKSYASRALNSLGCDPVNRKRWARHGSTRWLWNDQNVRDAVRYVVEEQGEPMAVFIRN